MAIFGLAKTLRYRRHRAARLGEELMDEEKDFGNWCVFHYLQMPIYCVFCGRQFKNEGSGVLKAHVEECWRERKQKLFNAENRGQSSGGRN
jgi:hypothetical protein